MPFTALDALRLGVIYLVDDNGQPLTSTPEEQLQLGECWAHLQDSETGQWYVHKFRRAAELEEERILAMVRPQQGYSNQNV